MPKHLKQKEKVAKKTEKTGRIRRLGKHRNGRGKVPSENAKNFSTFSQKWNRFFESIRLFGNARIAD